MDLSSGAAWGAFGAIVVANLLLSGDNAIVIAMAARSLPPPQRKLAVVWGSVAAIVLRIVLTVAAATLLQLPYLKLAGALALLWIGARLLVDGDAHDGIESQGTLRAAIRTILVADVVMSIDNVIAVAGAADSAPAPYRLPLLAAGLATSIPLIIAGSTMLLKVMERFPLIVTAGAALLGWLAGQMIASDPAIEGWLEAHLPRPDLVLAPAGAAVVVAAGTWMRRHTRVSAA